MTRSLPSSPALFALLMAVALSGCMTGKLPSAAFSGMTITTIQDQPGSEHLKLAVGFDFKVRNPLGIKLVIPDHTFGLEIDGSPVAETGTRRGFDVPKGSAKKVTYDFVLDLSNKGLGRAFGKDASFAFTAAANIDIPQKIFEILEDLPGAGVIPDGAMKAGEGLLETGLSAIDGVSSGGMGKAKLTFAHEGRLKLAKFPKIQPRDGGKPEVALVGQSQTANLDNLIGELTKNVEPLAVFLEQFENAVVNQQVDLPVGELLERLGVPSNLTTAALTAINGVLQLNGKQAIGSKNNTVAVPVQLPRLSSLLGSLDPKAGAKIDDFTSGWKAFKTNPALGSLMIPTALPQGIRVATPFQLENPNEFMIHAPTFKLGLVASDGSTVAMVAVGSPTSANAPLGSTRTQLVQVNAGANTPLELVSEFNWDKLGADLLGAAAGKPFDLSGLSLVGEVSVDPGYGPITVPIRISLSGGAAKGESSSSSAVTGSSKGESTSKGESSAKPSSGDKPSSGSSKPAKGSESSTGKTKPAKGKK